MKRTALRALLIAGAAALLVVPLLWSLTDAPPAAPDPIDPSLAPFLALEAGRSDVMKLTWGTNVTQQVTRELEGWRLHGERSYAVVTYLNHRDEAWEREWLRPARDPAGAATVVCGRRDLARRSYSIEPPLPLLVAPLEPDQRWSWEGRVGDVRCRAELRVLSRGHDAAGREQVVVEQRTRVPGAELASRRVVTWVAGLGPALEEGDCPTNEPTLGGQVALQGGLAAE